jgi:hypothetical protein
MPMTSAHAEIQAGLEFVVKLNDRMNALGGGTADHAEALARASETAEFVRSILDSMTQDEQARLVSSLDNLREHARGLAILVGLSLARRMLADLHKADLHKSAT